MVSAVRQMAKSKKEHRHLNTHWSLWQAVAYISSGALLLYHLLFSFRINISKFKSLFIFTKNKEFVCFQELWANWSAVQEGEFWGGWLKSWGQISITWHADGLCWMHGACTVLWAGQRVAVSLSKAARPHSLLMTAVLLGKQGHPRNQSQCKWGQCSGGPECLVQASQLPQVS